MQPYSTIEFPALEAGLLAQAILREGRAQPVFGACLPLAPAGKLIAMAQPRARANRAAPLKLRTLPYKYDAPGALSPEQREARLDGIADTLLDIFLNMSPEQQAAYRVKE